MSRAALQHAPQSARSNAAATTSLRVGPAHDAFEQEADQAAERVITGEHRRVAWSLSRVGLGLVQRQCSCGGTCEDCKGKKNELLQRRATSSAAGAGHAPASVSSILSRPGSALDGGTRRFMEQRFGYDFSRVRIHNDSEAADSARDVSANAYTVGSSIVFNHGKYQPHSPSGRKLLAHELAHVVQQGGGNLAVARTKDSGAPKLTAAQQSVQRQCSPAPCPVPAIPIGSFPPTPKQAEVCLQEQYAATHPNAKPGVSLGFNLGWTALTGRNLVERQALTCLKGGTTAKAGPNFTAKHGMFAAQPDIWDFANGTMYEITTAGQAVFKSGDTGKLAAQIKLANDITGFEECGRLMFSAGGWAPTPSPCCLLPSGLYISTVNVDGVLVYTPLKDATKELTLVALLTLLAALAKKGGGGAATQLAGAATKAAGKVAPVYAVATLVAAAVLLSSGMAQAKLGPGDEEPIAQLFKALAQKGSPVPPEIQQMIEDDPELKAKLDDAMRKGGDPSVVQKELNEKILKIIADHPDQFSKDDLEKILTMTAVAGKALPQGAATVDTVRKMLDKSSDASGSESGGDGKGSGADTPDVATPDLAKPSDGPAKAQDGNAPGSTGPTGDQATPSATGATAPGGLTEKGRERLGAAAKPVRSLFDSITAGAGAGAGAATDAVVDEYLSVVPADLTDEEAQKLVKRLADTSGKSTADVLASLRRGVAELRPVPHSKPPQAADGNVSADRKAPADGDKQAPGNTTAAAPGSGVGDSAAAASAKKTPTDTTASAPATGDKKSGPPASENENLAHLAAASDYSSIHKGQYIISWGNVKETRAELLNIDSAGVRSAGYVKVQILKIDRPNKTVTVKILSVTPLVAKDGSVQPPISGLAGVSKTLKIPGS